MIMNRIIMNRIIRVAAYLLASLWIGIVWADIGISEVPSASPQYTITELGSLGGLHTEPTSINDAGQIVGYSHSPDNTLHAFLWQRGKMTQLTPLQGDKSSAAYAINNKGQAVGVSIHSGGATHAIMWKQGSIINLGLTGNSDLNTGLVKSINDNGQMIVNFVSYPDNSIAAELNPALQHHRVLLCVGESIRSGRLLGRNIIDAVAINNSGSVVGEKLNSSGCCLSGYLWKDGMITDLGTFQPSGINESGEIVGTKRDGKQQAPTAAFWNNGTVTPLHFSASTGTLGTSINNKGEIIGVTNLAEEINGKPHTALLWRKGHYVDLNSSLFPRGEWTLIHPTAINNLGQIIGYGQHNGKMAAFLMTPTTSQVLEQ